MWDPLYRTLCSTKTLQQALLHLRTTQDLFYKDHYRNLLLAYGYYEEHHIQRLSERLHGKSYAPTDYMQLDVPRSNGMHRPIKLLHLDDLIVYQGIALTLAQHLGNHRKPFDYVTVFSHILNRNPDFPAFFYIKWQIGYRRFLRAIRRHYNRGNRWIAHFDLASFYSTIDHYLLAQQIGTSTYPDFTGLLVQCLRHWTSTDSRKLSHGLTQGPPASSYLAELYLLSIDRLLAHQNIQYVRYVDDYRIFGATRDELMHAIILLDRACQARGLIPQTSKYEIVHANTFEEAVGRSVSLTPDDKTAITAGDKSAAQLFLEAVNRQPFDISTARYILKSSGRNELIFRWVIEHIRDYPDLAYYMSIFLANYTHEADVAEKVFDSALKEPLVVTPISREFSGG